MRILLAGGGTAGHINPALAIAGYVCEKEPDTQILYVGAKGGMEERLVSKAGYNIKTIEISGFQRKLNFDALKKNLRTINLILKSSKQSKRIIKEFNPDICIGTGGYVSGPVIKEAQKMGIKTLIHEQNAYPGVTNKMLSKKADKVMLAVEDAKKHMSPNCDFAVTGNPVRVDIIKVEKENARKRLGLDERPVILSFGGSLGARAINEAMVEILVDTAKSDKYQHIHAYGKYGKWLLEKLADKGVNLKDHKNLDIREYIDNMPECLAAADIVICRAGAITISELQVKGKAAILIPSPNVAENHQYHNAMALVNRNAAQIIEEKDLNGKRLINVVKGIIEDKTKLGIYEKNIKTMAINDANKRIYKIIKGTLANS